MDVEMYPEPTEEMVIRRTPSGCGWTLHHDGETKAAFSTIGDLCSYLMTYLTPLDVEAGIISKREPPPLPRPDDELPKMFEAKDEPPKPGLWRVLRGGRA